MSVKTPTQGRAIQTRERIVAAARRLFSERGYADVSTQDVLERAGVSRGAVYHHFAGKRELMQAVMEEIEGELLEGLAGRLAGVEDPYEQIVVASQGYMDYCVTSDDLRRISLRDGRAALGWTQWREFALSYGLGVTIALVTNAQEAGRLSGDDPETLGHVVLGALIEAATMIAHSDDPAATRERVGRAVAVLIEGLEAPGR